jgi:hypothetical protein
VRREVLESWPEGHDTISLERTLGRITLTTKIATMDADEAAGFVERGLYPIQIKGDAENRGLFPDGIRFRLKPEDCPHKAVIEGGPLGGKVCVDCGEVLPADFDVDAGRATGSEG